MRLVAWFRARGVNRLTRLACWLALAGLSVMCFSILFPRPLAVIFAMSAGHAIGAAALACYLVAVVLDVSRGTRGNRAAATEPAREHEKD